MAIIIYRHFYFLQTKGFKMNNTINQCITSCGNAHKLTGRLIPKAEVLKLTGLSKSTIYAYIQQGKFPAPIKLGVRRVGWLEAEILGWIGIAVMQSRSNDCNNTNGRG